MLDPGSVHGRFPFQGEGCLWYFYHTMRVLVSTKEPSGRLFQFFEPHTVPDRWALWMQRAYTDDSERLTCGRGDWSAAVNSTLQAKKSTKSPQCTEIIDAIGGKAPEAFASFYWSYQHCGFRFVSTHFHTSIYETNVAKKHIRLNIFLDWEAVDTLQIKKK
jgi:hypothetical protein